MSSGVSLHLLVGHPVYNDNSASGGQGTTSWHELLASTVILYKATPKEFLLTEFDQTHSFNQFYVFELGSFQNGYENPIINKCT